MYPDAPIAVWRRRESATHELGDSTDVVFDLQAAMKFRPDAAIISVPASMHVARALSLAEAGIHLLVEKPLSHTLEGVNQLIEMCAAKRLILMVAYNMRFYEPLQAQLDGPSGSGVKSDSIFLSGDLAQTIRRPSLPTQNWVGAQSSN
jgi:hypothetical protein